MCWFHLFAGQIVEKMLSTCLGFDDMDSMFASPEDFRNLNHRDKTRSLHLLEYFVNHCHEIGVYSYSYSGY